MRIKWCFIWFCPVCLERRKIGDGRFSHLVRFAWIHMLMCWKSLSACRLHAIFIFKFFIRCIWPKRIYAFNVFVLPHYCSVYNIIYNTWLLILILPPGNFVLHCVKRTKLKLDAPDVFDGMNWKICTSNHPKHFYHSDLIHLLQVNELAIVTSPTPMHIHFTHIKREIASIHRTETECNHVMLHNGTCM